LMGNGILTFIHRASGLDRLFGEDCAVYFDSDAELLEQVLQFQENDDERRRIARCGRELSFRHFSSDTVAQFIVEKTMQLSPSREYIWDDDHLLASTSRSVA
jgi:spore maturation protein CgeB